MKFIPIYAAALLILLSACSQPKEVNIYSARHYETDQALYTDFTDQTGIKVNLIEGGSDELIERIKSEGVNSPADILVTVDAGRIWRAEEAGILGSIESEVLNERIPNSYRHPDGLWYGISKRVRAIVVNPEKVENTESLTYEDLATEEWKGRVCIRSSNNIYNQSLMASIIEANGPAAAEAWAKGIVQNMAREPQGGDRDQIRAVAAGICDAAVVNHYYLAMMLTGDEENQEIAKSVELVFPNQSDIGRGAHVNISVAGVVKDAPNRENAIKFMEYLTNETSQTYLTVDNNEYPINEDAGWNPVLQGFGDFKEDEMNVSALGKNNPQAIRIMDRAGWK
jgi:iron(III) transport system substrate-binding protein